MSRCFRSPAERGPGQEAGSDDDNRSHDAEAVVKRGAAHYHEHHCGPESIIPVIEAAIRRGMVEA